MKKETAFCATWTTITSGSRIPAKALDIVPGWRISYMASAWRILGKDSGWMILVKDSGWRRSNMGSGGGVQDVATETRGVI